MKQWKFLIALALIAPTTLAASEPTPEASKPMGQEPASAGLLVDLLPDASLSGVQRPRAELVVSVNGQEQTIYAQDSGAPQVDGQMAQVLDPVALGHQYTEHLWRSGRSAEPSSFAASGSCSAIISACVAEYRDCFQDCRAAGWPGWQCREGCDQEYGHCVGSCAGSD